MTDDDRSMDKATHEVPRTIVRWDRYNTLIESGDLEVTSVRFRRLSADARAILAATAPDGMSLDAWADTVAQAVEAEAAWVDPLRDGSAGWREFVGADDEISNPAVPAEEPALAPFEAVGTSAFLRALSEHGGDRRMKTKVAVLRAVARFANESGGESFPSRATIAQHADVSETTVKRTLRWASEVGWLAEVRRIGRDVAVWQLQAPVGASETGQVAA